MILELLLCLIMNYPSLYGHTYTETANSFSKDILFVTNDLLLCIMLFVRAPYWINVVISTSKYLEPRAQRVCTIYGCDANNMFAVKAVMKADSKKIVFVGLFTSLMLFSYNLRLFERQIYNTNIDSSNPFLAFKDITTSMWNTLITMTTVGYGEFFAQSHCGRCIAIMAALWGTCNTSILVVALNN